MRYHTLLREVKQNHVCSGARFPTSGTTSGEFTNSEPHTWLLHEKIFWFGPLARGSAARRAGAARHDTPRNVRCYQVLPKCLTQFAAVEEMLIYVRADVPSHIGLHKYVMIFAPVRWRAAFFLNRLTGAWDIWEGSRPSGCEGNHLV